MFFGGGIISASGGEFVRETAEPEAFAFDSDFYGVTAGALFEIYAKVLRGSFGFVYSPVAGVLRVGGDAEIGTAVVERVVIDVVNDKFSF